MGKSSGGIRNASGKNRQNTDIVKFGRVGYAVYDQNGEQLTKALFGEVNALSKGYESGKAAALSTMERYIKYDRIQNKKGWKYTVKKAKNR